MENILNKVKAGVAAIGGLIAYFLGGMDTLLKALLFFMALDYISGVLNAAGERKLSSRTGFRGIAKKVYLLVIVAVAFVVEKLVNSVFPLREVVIMFFVANEGISIIENAVSLGVPIPKQLKNALIKMKADNEEEEN